jgi:hypothetical protein
MAFNENTHANYKYMQNLEGFGMALNIDQKKKKIEVL